MMTPSAGRIPTPGTNAISVNATQDELCSSPSADGKDKSASAQDDDADAGRI
jgi:hypothetical protein